MSKIRSRLWLLSSILIMVMWIGVGFVGADQKTEQLIAKLEAKAKTINSYRTDMTMNMEMMGQKIIYTGKLAFKNPMKSRMEMNGKIGGMDMTQIIISDGKTAWTYQPNMKMAHKMDLEKIIAETGIDTGQKNGDPSHPFQSLNRDSITYIRTDKIDGRDVYIFQGIPQATGTENMPFIPNKLEIGIDAGNGMISKMVMLNEEGKEMMSQSYSNTQLNIPDTEFEFTVPEGVQDRRHNQYDETDEGTTGTAGAKSCTCGVRFSKLGYSIPDAGNLYHFFYEYQASSLNTRI